MQAPDKALKTKRECQYVRSASHKSCSNNTLARFRIGFEKPFWLVANFGKTRMRSILWILALWLTQALARADVANYTLKPYDGEDDTQTTPGLRSLPPPPPFSGENSGSNGPYGPGSNQQIQNPSAAQMQSPFGPPIAPMMPMPQFGQGGMPPMRLGQQGGYPWLPQGYFGQQGPNPPYLQGWPGYNRPQQFNPYAQQQPGSFPGGLQQIQFGQQPMPMPSPYYGGGGAPVPYSPYQAPGPQYGPPPPPPPGFFQGGPGPMDGDDRFSPDRRNYDSNGPNQSPFGQRGPVGQNPPQFGAPKGLPLFPVPPAFPGAMNGMGGGGPFNGGKPKGLI